MRRVTVPLAVALLALAGCGGSSQPSTSDFKKAFVAQRAQLSTLGQEVGAAVTGATRRTDAELTAEFGHLAARATALAGALGELNAPARYRSDLAALQSSVTQVAGTLHSIEAAAAAHDATAAKAGGEAIVTDAQQVRSDDDALSAKLGLPTSP